MPPEAVGVGAPAKQFLLLLLLLFSFFGLFRAAPVAYGGSQARVLIRAVAASLPHSHSNM